MKIDSPLPTYIAYKVGYFTDSDLIEWANAYLPNSIYFTDNPDLIELMLINTKVKNELEKAGTCLKNFIDKQWPKFNLSSSKAEMYAEKFFMSRLKEYLADRCRLYDVCKMISPIEQIYDFPDWLGNMYNACNWIEPETLPADCKYLEPEIEKTLKL